MNSRRPGGLGELRRLANLYNIQTSYLDMDRKRIWASADSLVAALTARGALLESGVPLAERQRLLDLWSWRLDPVAVAWDRGPVAIRLRLPEASAGRLEVELSLESSETSRATVTLESLAVTSDQDVNGERFVERNLDLGGLGLTPKDGLPFGYHALSVSIAGRRLESCIICAPTKFYAPAPRKRWGIFAPLYALHSHRSWGLGDLTDLSNFIEFAAGRQADFVATLPILASFLDNPFDPSPYAPVSRLFWNELYVDPAEPPGNGAGLRDWPRLAALLNDEDLVPHRAAMALKRQAMDWQAGNFIASDKGRAQLDAFLDSKPATRDYARFRAAVERLGPNWRDWPAKQRSGKLTAQDYDPRAVNYHAYAQWRVDVQLRSVATAAKSKNVGLYLDLPIGVHARGYDAWRYRDLFVDAMSVGAPPDPVTNSGQNWGFPPIDPQALRRSGYGYLRDYLRHHLSVAGVLRLDHVMGLHRLYWIPAGGSAHDGLYVSNPYEELYAVHSLESYRHKAVIIGEDLGVASRELPRNLVHHGVTRLYVVEISLLGPPEEPLLPIPKRVAASIGTHDLPPFASWWQNLDIEGRKALGVLSGERATIESEERAPKRRQLIAYLREKGLLAPDAEALQDVLRALLQLLGSSAADWLVVSLEDLWLETQPQNVPGTTDDQHPNWRHRAAHGIEELDKMPEIKQTLSIVREARTRM